MSQTELPRLCFMHLQKTAGISLGRLLTYAYPARDRLPTIYSFEHLANWTVEEIQQRKLFIGHFGVLMYELLPQPTVGVTVLRDPVERTLSHMKYFQTGLRSTSVQSELAEKVEPLLRGDWHGYLDSPIAAGLDNFMTRQLGVHFDIQTYLTGDENFSGAVLSAAVLKARLEANLDVAFTNATQLLSKLGVVGVTERFDETMFLVCDLLSIVPPSSLQLNRAASRKSNGDHSNHHTIQFPPDVVERVTAMTAYDRKLYQQAQALLEEELTQRQRQPVQSIHYGRSLNVAFRVRVQSPIQEQFNKTVRRMIGHMPSILYNKSLRQKYGKFFRMN